MICLFVHLAPSLNIICQHIVAARQCNFTKIFMMHTTYIYVYHESVQASMNFSMVILHFVLLDYSHCTRIYAFELVLPNIYQRETSLADAKPLAHLKRYPQRFTGMMHNAAWHANSTRLP
jgi:hypothetical protein